ncbi:MAG: bacillithiol biosynthesis cysteine-adding enzyme BshC [Balneolaceae bacterium]
MDCTPYPFHKLPFSDLFCSYIRQEDSLSPFFSANPFNEESIREYSDGFRFAGDRETSVELLRDFQEQFGARQPTYDQIDRLADPEAVAIVTGQQLMIYGGPLFTIYKTITAILYARRWEVLLGRPVIPVFWLADEDHDFPEAAKLGVLTNSDFQTLELAGDDLDVPVGRRLLGDDFERFRAELFDLLPETDFSEPLKGVLDRFYKKGVSFRQAFGSLMLHLFGSEGLVLAGSDTPEIKQAVLNPLLNSAEKHREVFQRLEGQSRDLEASGYHRQAVVQSSNLFFLDETGGRQKLDVENTTWSTGNGESWSSPELIKQISETPERFSPNVFLRPLVQDRLLPTLAYVGGPGEIAYYAQMKALYSGMDQQMPVILPRFSASLIEPAIDRILEKLPFEAGDFQNRIEDLESAYIEKVDRLDVETLFTDWKEQVSTITSKKVEQIKTIDPTLSTAADKAGTLFENELNQLKGKVYKSMKREEEIQLNRIRRIKENLFPDNGLQERSVGFLCYMNKYGPDIWNRLLELLEDQTPDTHKLIRL